jgi:hypothetical protein
MGASLRGRLLARHEDESGGARDQRGRIVGGHAQLRRSESVA